MSLWFGSYWRSGDSECVIMQVEFTFQKEALTMTLVREHWDSISPSAVTWERTREQRPNLYTVSEKERGEEKQSLHC